MPTQNPVRTSHRIEVSGWDLDENFFVEKTNLDWSEKNGKTVSLRRPLRDGSVVFIRLITSTASGHSLPAAHQVESSEMPSPSGMWEVRLVQLHPRSRATAPSQRPPVEVAGLRSR